MSEDHSVVSVNSRRLAQRTLALKGFMTVNQLRLAFPVDIFCVGANEDETLTPFKWHSNLVL